MFEKIYSSAKDKLKGYLRYVLLLISALFVLSFARNIARINRATSKIEEAQENVEKLKQDNRKLKERLESVKTQEYREKQLRDKLGLAKEGEVVVVLPDEEILRKLAPSYEEEEETLPDPNWKKWLKLFF